MSAIEDEDPVLFFEHKRLYYELKEEVPEGVYRVPLGKGVIRREGEHVSLITYGGMVQMALRAAATLHEEGIELEVVDLRSLVPLDEEIMLQSFRKTNRVIILHEAQRRGGVGAELEAVICEKGFDALAAPPVRITAKETPVPVAPALEDFYLPSEQEVIDAAKRLVQY